MRRVNIYRWTKPELPDGNFGDELSIPLLERLFGIEAVPVETHRAELLAAGSILGHHYTRMIKKKFKPSMHGAEVPRELHVWGTGVVQNDKPVVWPQRLVISAVRGSITADHLGVSNVVFGDPGILVSRLFDRPSHKRYRVALVTHYTDADDAANLDLPQGWKLVDPRRPPLDVIAEIAAAELVISSSLHGLIVADAFEIPCVWLANTKPLWGPTPHLKFHDHETARQQSFGGPVNYIELLSRTPEQIADLTTLPGRDVGKWQEELIAAFPLK
jgi:pyruvyltransferase